jgi:hypothetical protein
MKSEWGIWVAAIVLVGAFYIVLVTVGVWLDALQHELAR